MPFLFLSFFSQSPSFNDIHKYCCKVYLFSYAFKLVCASFLGIFVICEFTCCQIHLWLKDTVFCVLISAIIYEVYISENILILIRSFIMFSTSQSFPSSVLLSPWILCFFLQSLTWWQSLVSIFFISWHEISVGWSKCVQYVFCSIWPLIAYSCWGYFCTLHGVVLCSIAC